MYGINEALFVRLRPFSTFVTLVAADAAAVAQYWSISGAFTARKQACFSISAWRQERATGGVTARISATRLKHLTLDGTRI